MFFGRAADEVIGEEHLWQVGTNAWVVVDDRDVLAERVGTAMVTLGVTDLDEILARLAAHGVGHGPVETYSNGVPEFRRKASGRLPLGILRRPIPATMPGHVSSP
ncbi:hypothetical protein [Spirillospora sp. NPDC048823]|uniref:hypothetical protein n=1 Tax=unclassified Spirillospora TaxID=2642701 RepID=UPI00370FCA6B